MTYEEIEGRYFPINKVEESHVLEIMESMRKNGYVGCPILIYGDRLLTGSHRLVALERLAEENDEVYDWEVAEDVSDIVNGNYSEFIEKNGYYPDIDYRDIGWLLKNSRIEDLYKNEIEEW